MAQSCLALNFRGKGHRMLANGEAALRSDLELMEEQWRINFIFNRHQQDYQQDNNGNPPRTKTMPAPLSPS